MAHTHTHVEYNRAGDITILNTEDFPDAKVFIIWGPVFQSFPSLEAASATFRRLQQPVPGEAPSGYRRFVNRLFPGLDEE